MVLQTFNEPWQKVESAPALLVHSLSVLNPVQIVVQVYCQALVVLHSVHIYLLDGNRWRGCFPPTEVHHQRLCLTSVKLHSTKEFTTPLCLAMFPSLMQPVIAESSKNVYRWHDIELYLKSKVHRMSMTTTYVLLNTVSDTQPCSLTFCGRPVR